MGTITAQSFIDRMGATLRDDTNVHWTVEEALTYLSDAQRAAVEIRPEINPITARIRLEAGSRQRIPDGMTSGFLDDATAASALAPGFSLIGLVRDMGTDGETPDRAVRITTRDTLDNSYPDWHADVPGGYSEGTVVHYTYDADARRWFYVFPRQPATLNIRHWVELVYSAIPAEILAAGTAIGIDDMYQPLLLHYMLYRAYSKQINVQGSEQNAQKASGYYQLFFRELQGSRQGEMNLNPLKKAEEHLMPV